VGSLVVVAAICLGIFWVYKRGRCLQLSRLLVQGQHSSSPFTTIKNPSPSKNPKKSVAHASSQQDCRDHQAAATSEPTGVRHRERQRALEDQIRQLQLEVDILNQEATESGASARPAEDHTNKHSEEQNPSDQLRQARAYIAFLQGQLYSPWALGISDEPPPVYELASAS
jgi:TolA-binding protein